MRINAPIITKTIATAKMSIRTGINGLLLLLPVGSMNVLEGRFVGRNEGEVLGIELGGFVGKWLGNNVGNNEGETVGDVVG